MIYRFAGCCLDTGRHRFERDGAEVRLEPQVFDLLQHMAESAGALVSRDDLVARVWSGLNVSDATIDARINAARRAVGDDGKAQRVLQTVPRRGFRLAVPVVGAAEAEVAEPAVAAVARPRELPALAVLPFDHHAADPTDMLADGIVDEITGALSRVREFQVIARQSAYALQGARTDIRSAAAALGADYLVEGTVRRSADRVRIAVDLADAGGRTLWSARFDDRIDDLFDLQDRIAAQVAGQLPGNLRTAEIARSRSHAPRDRDARDLILQAMPHFWAHRREANAEAIALLSQALERDPDYVPAMAYKAWALVQQPSYVWSDDPAADRAAAMALALRAAERVGDDPASLVAISAVHAMGSADGSAAATIFARRALEIDPNNAWGHMRLGWALLGEGAASEALDAFGRARRLSPLDPFLFNMLIGTAVGQAQLGDNAGAIRGLEHTLTEFPGVRWAYRILATFYGRIGDDARARQAGKRLLDAYPDLTIRRLLDSIPPWTVQQDRDYVAGLRAAGIPEG